jgi:hypothetical protein
MAGQLLLINPRRRKARKARKSSHRRARRHNPVRALRHRARKHHARRRNNPIHRARRAYRRRRNPLSLRSMGGGIMGQATGALMGAGGALLNDLLMSYVPLPAMLKTGPGAILTKAAGAFAVGYLAKFAVGAHRGAQLTEGALTVLAYQVVKPMVQTVLPGLAGSEIEGLGYYSPGMILQDSLSPLKDLNAGTPLQAYISGLGDVGEGAAYDPSIDAYIS